jgi:uncharacterized protein (TIGR04222 family)
MIAITSPFDLRGPEFLKLYALLMAGGCIAAGLLRRLLRGPGGEPDAFDLQLDPYDAAYLNGGADAAITAAVATLLHRGDLKLRVGSLLERTGIQVPHGLHPVERAVFSNVSDSTTTSPPRLREIVRPYITSPTLEARELIVPESRKPLIRFATLLPMLAVLTIGTMKIMVGLSRNRPVGFLVMLCLATRSSAC